MIGLRLIAAAAAAVVACPAPSAAVVAAVAVHLGIVVNIHQRPHFLSLYPTAASPTAAATTTDNVTSAAAADDITSAAEVLLKHIVKVVLVCAAIFAKMVVLGVSHMVGMGGGPLPTTTFTIGDGCCRQPVRGEGCVRVCMCLNWPPARARVFFFWRRVKHTMGQGEDIAFLCGARPLGTGKNIFRMFDVLQYIGTYYVT